MKDTYKYYKEYGYTKTDDKKIVGRVKKLLKKHKKQTLIKDGLWELKLLSKFPSINGLILTHFLYNFIIFSNFHPSMV